MAESALAAADEVLFVLPRVFPHKEYAGAGFADRLELLRAALSGEPRFSLASSRRGLFIELAGEARQDYGAGVELFLLCGRDAAERIVAWDYGSGESIEKQLETYQLLVVSRGGPYTPPERIRNRVRSLPLPPGIDEISSTEVRTRLRAGLPWRHLVPAAVAARMEQRMDLWRKE
jgi:nicotinate-nucleotide adenylyltransferase